MGLALTIAAYLAAAVFVWKIFWHAVLWMRARAEDPAVGAPPSPAGVARAVLDVLFLLRLLKVNPGLWVGEWLFHVSFILVVIKHLVYFLNPVPAAVGALQTAGAAAGYVLAFSLIYIFIYRFAVERGAYVSAYNLFLTLTILAASLSGILLRLVWKTDLVEIKGFMIRALFFSAGAELPGGWLFWAHVLAILILIPALPTHILTAPFTTLNYRLREKVRPLHEG